MVADTKLGFAGKCLRLFFLSFGSAILVQYAPAVPNRLAPEESAATRVFIIVPGSVESFANHRLEVILHEYDPRAKVTEIKTDVHVMEAFRHTRGDTTAVNVRVGANAIMKRDLQYYVTVTVYNMAGKRTHLGEEDGKRGGVSVITAGNPNQVTMLVRQARPRDVVMDIADEIKKGNDAKAKKMAEARAKDFEGLFDIEDLHRRRYKNGMGWGSTPSKLPGSDGLEAKLLGLARAVPGNFFQDAKNNEEAAYWIAALAELTAAKPEFQPMGNKTKADWLKKAGQMRTEADAFARAIAAKNGPAVQKSAQAIMNTCANCHNVYRD